jgi:RpiR family transcriptional regulator, carbohydrate utilization regulator
VETTVHRRGNRSRRSSSTQSSAPLLIYLQGVLTSLNPTEKRIAEYILEDPERVLYHTISQMREGAGASVGSIVGFCRRVGTRGFADLKIKLALEFAQGGLLSSENGNDEKPQSIFDQVFHFHASSLAETRLLNSEETLMRASEALEKARCTYFFSTGLSYAVAYTAYCKLRLIGLPAHVESDAHMQIVTASQLKKGDVAFAISCSGRTHETVRCLRIAQSRKALTICLTNSIKSPITECADIALHATPSEIKYYQAPLASRVTQFAIVDALFESIARRRKRETTKRLHRISQSLIEHRLP